MADCDLIDDLSYRPTFDTSESDKDLEEPAAAVSSKPPNGTITVPVEPFLTIRK